MQARKKKNRSSTAREIAVPSAQMNIDLPPSYASVMQKKKMLLELKARAAVQQAIRDPPPSYASVMAERLAGDPPPSYASVRTKQLGQYQRAVEAKDAMLTQLKGEHAQSRRRKELGQYQQAVEAKNAVMAQINGMGNQLDQAYGEAAVKALQSRFRGNQTRKGLQKALREAEAEVTRRVAVLEELKHHPKSRRARMVEALMSEADQIYQTTRNKRAVLDELKQGAGYRNDVNIIAQALRNKDAVFAELKQDPKILLTRLEERIEDATRTNDEALAQILKISRPTSHHTMQ
jgi:hypothetical protein